MRTYDLQLRFVFELYFKSREKERLLSEETKLESLVGWSSDLNLGWFKVTPRPLGLADYKYQQSQELFRKWREMLDWTEIGQETANWLLLSTVTLITSNRYRSIGHRTLEDAFFV